MCHHTNKKLLAEVDSQIYLHSRLLTTYLSLWSRKSMHYQYPTLISLYSSNHENHRGNPAVGSPLPRFSFDRNLDNVLLLRHDGEPGGWSPPSKASHHGGTRMGPGHPRSLKGATEMQAANQWWSQIRCGYLSWKRFLIEMVWLCLTCDLWPFISHFLLS